jgi:hypothetical protein
VPASRYPTENRRVSRRVAPRTFERGDPSFLAPGSVLDAPSGMPPAPTTVAGVAGAGETAFFGWAALPAIVAGAALGYWATRPRKLPAPKPYWAYAGNQHSWSWSDTHPDYGTMPGLTVPSSGWYNRAYEYHECEAGGVRWQSDCMGGSAPGVVAYPFRNPAYHNTGTPCVGPPPARHDGGIIGFNLATLRACNPNGFPLFISRYKNDAAHTATSLSRVDHIVASYVALDDNLVTHPSNVWVQDTPGKQIPGFATPATWYPNEWPELAPQLWPARPVPQPYRTAVPDVPYPVNPDFAPVEVPTIFPPPFPIVLVPLPLPGGAPAPQPGTGPSPVPAPGSGMPATAPDGSVFPDQVIQSQPGGGVIGGYVPPAGSQSPPQPREKERKVNVKSRFGGFWAFLNVLSERNELLDDLWRALPKELKTKRFHNGKRVRARPQDKLADLYRGWQHLDIASAVENYANDQFSDYFYAIPGKVQTAATRRMFDATGLGNLVGRGVRSRWLPQPEDNLPPVPKLSDWRAKQLKNHPERRFEIRDLYKG